jgi:sugar O-acyltransferase (sialic acid O-acetyltransferase NeuD family)
MKVAIFGSGGTALETIGYMHGDPRYEIAAAVSTEQFNNWDYAARFEVFSRVPPGIDAYIMAVADPALKRKFVAENTDRWITYAHPSVHISSYARIGRGSWFAAGSMICGDAVIGRFVTYNVYAQSGHGCKIGAYSTFSPYATTCGDCEVGEGVFFGTRATVVPRIKIVSGAKVSAGAVVRHNITEPCTVYGDPAAERQKRRTA